MDPTEKMLARARLRRLIETGEAKAIRERAGVSLYDVAKSIRRDLQPSTLLTWEADLHRPRIIADELAWLRALDQLRAITEEEEPAELAPAGATGP
jgi:hypothetical protein